MIYKPDNQFVNWDLPEEIPTEHWQQLIRMIPYVEMVKFLNDNPPIKYTIIEGTKC